MPEDRCSCLWPGPPERRTDRCWAAGPVQSPHRGRPGFGSRLRSVGHEQARAAPSSTSAARRPARLYAEPLPQPPACARPCRVRLGLRDLAHWTRGCNSTLTATASEAQGVPCCDRPLALAEATATQEENAWRTRSENRAQGSWRPLPLGRHLAGQRLRLLRARLLDLRAPGNRAPAQLVRARGQGPAHSLVTPSARRPALLLGLRPRRPVRRPRPHGARSPRGRTRPGREARRFGLRPRARCRTAPSLTDQRLGSSSTMPSRATTGGSSVFDSSDLASASSCSMISSECVGS